MGRCNNRILQDIFKKTFTTYKYELVHVTGWAFCFSPMAVLQYTI